MSKLCLCVDGAPAVLGGLPEGAADPLRYRQFNTHHRIPLPVTETLAAAAARVPATSQRSCEC